jgi:hypothetical protein
MQLRSDALKEAAAWPDAGQRTPVVLACQLLAADAAALEFVPAVKPAG